jgi:hypothetical protein
MYFVFTCRHRQSVDSRTDDGSGWLEEERSHEYSDFAVSVVEDTQYDASSLGSGYFESFFSKPIANEALNSAVYVVVKYVTMRDTFNVDHDLLEVAYFGQDFEIAQKILEDIEDEKNLASSGYFADEITGSDLMTFKAPFAVLPQRKK